MNNSENDNNIFIDDNNVVDVSKQNIKDALMYVGLKNIIAIKHGDEIYNPPFPLKLFNGFNQNTKIDFNCKCSKIDSITIKSITERIKNKRCCATCTKLNNNKLYNDIINIISVEDILSFSKEGKTKEFINIDVFSKSLEHIQELKKHDNIQVKCSTNNCNEIRNCRVFKIFKEQPFNRLCSSCSHKIGYKKNENGGILPENFVLTPNKSCWEKSREKLIDAEKKVQQLSSINDEQYNTIKVMEETVENLKNSIETSSTDLFITQNNVPELELINGYKLEYRNSDGYINVTDLCKAAGKEYYKWKQFSKTKPFLEALSKRTLRGCLDLIRSEVGGPNHKTWVHPYVAINIAQWASPDFAAQVCIWVFEIIVTGKVDSSNPTDYNILQEKFQKSLQELEVIKSDYSLLQANNIELKKKYCKRKKNNTENKENVVYILTTELLKSEGRYIFGKSKNMKNRLPTYNKTDEHIVIYTISCSSETNMNALETLIFNQLSECRECGNRERFILPENKTIDYFKDMFDECYNIMENVKNIKCI